MSESVTGFEPATLGLEVPRAIQLRHTDRRLVAPLTEEVWHLNQKPNLKVCDCCMRPGHIDVHFNSRRPKYCVLHERLELSTFGS